MMRCTVALVHPLRAPAKSKFHSGQPLTKRMARPTRNRLSDPEIEASFGATVDKEEEADKADKK